MANAVVIRAEQSPPPIDRVVLTLTEKEARIVLALTGSLSGSDGGAGYRAASDAVYAALLAQLGADQLPYVQLRGGYIERA